MCGIVGVLTDHEAAPILVEALKRLEYRGYDSAGIATVHNGMLDRRRAVGKLHNLADLLVYEPLPGKAGIGHTRWATHGGPTVRNAHPHRAGRVVVVHNGIIENYRALKEALADREFESDTDTETIAHLCETFLDRGMSPREAAAETLKHLEGAFALAFLFDGEEDLIVAARKGSPLAIGHGEGEMYVGSDAIALSPLTDRITYLDEGDYAFVTRSGVEIRDADGRQVHRDTVKIAAQAAQVDKAGHKHFMVKEIFEQPTVLAQCLAHYTGNGAVELPDADLDFAATDRLIMVACGTAHYACLVAKYWFEQIAGLPCDVDIASEFRYREPPVSDRATALFVSQSGETADTLAALRYTRDKAMAVVSLVNVPQSSIARESDTALPILAGVEIGVASTKAFMNQLGALACLAILAGRQRGQLTPRARSGACRHTPEPACDDQPGARARGPDPPPDRQAGRGTLGPVPRPGSNVSDGAGRRAETQGNQLYPRRGLCQRRAQAWAHRAGGQQPSGDRSGPARRSFRQDGIEHAGGDGARRQGLARQRRRGRGAGRRGRLGDADASHHRPGLRADALRGPGAAESPTTRRSTRARMSTSRATPPPWRSP